MGTGHGHCLFKTAAKRRVLQAPACTRLCYHFNFLNMLFLSEMFKLFPYPQEGKIFFSFLEH